MDIFSALSLALNLLDIFNKKLDADNKLLDAQTKRERLEAIKSQRMSSQQAALIKQNELVMRIFTNNTRENTARLLRGLPSETAFAYIVHWLIMENTFPAGWCAAGIKHFAETVTTQEMQKVVLAYTKTFDPDALKTVWSDNRWFVKAKQDLAKAKKEWNQQHYCKKCKQAPCKNIVFSHPFDINGPTCLFICQAKSSK